MLFKCLYEWMVFGGLFVVGGVGKFVMLVGEFFESYDIWWGWCWGGCWQSMRHLVHIRYWA